MNTTPYQKRRPLDFYSNAIWCMLFFMKMICLFFGSILAACTPVSHLKITERAIGFSFVERAIIAQPFILTSYTRIGERGTVGNIYIEGDGRAWLSKRRPSFDPTPKNPVALKLATIDPSDNVIYLARPCQYTKMVNGSACDQKYWTSHRFAPEVIGAMSAALDDIKQRHNIKNFNLIGFSGGGNVAALLAARRDDVVSIRTVAGNLDHELQSDIHGVSQMPHSLNAKDIAQSIVHIPQFHFIGGQDKIVPKDLYDSYKKASGGSDCVQSRIIEAAGHTKGWESVWKSLLSQSLDCEKQ